MTASQDQLRAIQSKRLSEVVAYVYGNNPLYRQAFDAAGVAPGAIRSVADIAALPTIITCITLCT